MNLYLKQETYSCINNIIWYGWSPAYKNFDPYK